MNLIELLDNKNIKTPLKSEGKDDVIIELVQILVDGKRIKDSTPIVRAILEREELSSTGLCDGIAIPHAKTDLVDSLTVALGISPNGIDFDALDGNDSTLFFLLLSPINDSSAHMQALSEISRLAQSQSFKTDLLKAKTADEVVTIFKGL